MGSVLCRKIREMEDFCAKRILNRVVTGLFILVVFSANAQVSVLTRGPYLQKLSPTNITIHWKTLLPEDSKVSYGTNPADLNLNTSNILSTTDHIITLSDLKPYTVYYYNIGSTTAVLQGDENNHFLTAPLSGKEEKYTFWVTGDCGNNSTNQQNVLAAYNDYMGSKPTNVWLTLGDNAYTAGLDAEFQTNFFSVYDQNIAKHAPLFSAPGNHDYNNNPIQQATHLIDYYTIFDLPSNGESGGVASGTEAFYSYDYDNVHFLALDSYGQEELMYRLYDTLGPQAQWIKQDLAANTKPWVIAYWHHPPYTMASHNSDTEGELVDMRANFMPFLEGLGVDLVLCGHSHGYERSHLMKGHYGMENTYDAAIHNVDGSTAYYDGSDNSCAYMKDQRHSQDGTVYVVAGSAGQLGGQQTSFPHDALPFADVTNGGSLLLEVEGNRLDAKFLCTDGVIRDQFTMLKNTNQHKTVQVIKGQAATLTASWPGDHIWSNGAHTRSIEIFPTQDSYYTVADNYECAVDSFFVDVIEGNEVKAVNANAALNLYPNPTKDLLNLEASSVNSELSSIKLIDFSGRIVLNEKLDNTSAAKKTLSVSHLPKGVYLVQLSGTQQQILISEKLIIE